MGFVVRDLNCADHNFRELFDSLVGRERIKGNYLLLQSELIDYGLGESAIFDLSNISKLNSLYETSNK